LAATGAAVLTAGVGLAAAISIVADGDEAVQTTPWSTTPNPQSTQPGGISPPPFKSELDRILAGLPLANAAFNAPATLKVNESAVIQLFLSGEQPIRKLQDQLTELGEKEGARIRASDRMEARLSGLGFKIEAISPAVQLVSGQGVTEWRWEIEPTRVGTRRLHLTLSALIDLKGIESPYAVRTFERSLDVRVTWGERLTGFVSDNWQWLWTALLIPLGGWALSRRRDRSRDRSRAGRPRAGAASPSRRARRRNRSGSRSRRRRGGRGGRSGSGSGS
jgi:hypothetical protein